jgi:Tfp pilus assembly protein PilF
MSGRPSRALILLAALLAAACSGCAGWRPMAAPDVAQQRQEREQEAVQTFEAHRDDAQLQAALDRWSQGDVSGCEARLRALLARHPDDAEVRLRLAEVLWSREALEAEGELRQVLAAQPERAEAHHLLGMMLAEQQRLAEARVHLARACELDPDCTIYQTTCESLPTGSVQP